MRKGLFINFIIVALLIILMPYTKTNANTEPKLTKVAILTEEVIPGGKVYMELEGITSDMKEIKAYMAGESLYITCNVFDINTDNPYFIMPNQATEGNSWKLGVLEVIYNDDSKEMYSDTAASNIFGVPGNKIVNVVSDYATVQLKTATAKKGEKVYLDIDIPDKESVTWGVLWFNTYSCYINDIATNPYIQINDIESFGTTNKMSQLAIRRGNDSNIETYIGDRFKVNGNEWLTIASKAVQRIDIEIPTPLIGNTPADKSDIKVTVNQTQTFEVDEVEWVVNDENILDDNQVFENDKKYTISLAYKRPNDYYIDDSVKAYVNGTEIDVNDFNQINFGNYGYENYNFDCVSFDFEQLKYEAIITLNENEKFTNEKIFLDIQVPNIKNVGYISFDIEGYQHPIYVSDLKTSPWIKIDKIGTYKINKMFVILSDQTVETYSINFDESINEYKLNIKGNNQINIIDKVADIAYKTHIQDIGWENELKINGDISGTTGQALRLEAIEILYGGDYLGDIQYRTHIQDIGWENDWKSNGEKSGTEGRSLRLEAIEIKLTGEVANYYDVYYRVHAENFGWLGWTKNGAPAGTQGYAYRLEAIQVMLVKKGEEAPEETGIAFKANTKVQYSSHVQNIGWQNYVENGELSGTEGQSLRLEGLKINIDGSPYSGDIVYSTHIENIGWQGEVRNNQMSGTQGQSLRLEAMTIRLTGELAEHYTIRYRVHVQDIGWQDWKEDGQIAGTTGLSKRLEGLEIQLVEKK